jgi:hypothetical protein
MVEVVALYFGVKYTPFVLTHSLARVLFKVTNSLYADKLWGFLSKLLVVVILFLFYQLVLLVCCKLLKGRLPSQQLLFFRYAVLEA